ncbi:General transcription and DNA repair factor IIH subunit TFB4-like protein [Drosera capensis]
MAPPSKLYSDDVSLIVLLLDTNPYFWTAASNPSSPLSFSTFLSHVLSFLNSILLLNQLNQVVVIATGYNSCGYVYDSSLSSLSKMTQSSGNGVLPGFCEELLENLEGFLEKDEKLSSEEFVDGVPASLLSGSLSMALCCILSGSVDDLATMLDEVICRCDGKLSRRSFVVLQDQNDAMVPIDACVIGSQHSAFLQQASYITGGVYLKPPLLEGLFQYLSTVFVTDLHSRNFLQLPKPVGVDFRASSVFGQSQAASASDRKRKDPQE